MITAGGLRIYTGFLQGDLWRQWTELRLLQIAGDLHYKIGFNTFLAAIMDSHDEDVLDSDDEVVLYCNLYSDGINICSMLDPPSPPWVLEAACKFASFAHKLLLRQEYRDQHYMTHMAQPCKSWDQGRYKHYRMNNYGCLLRALKKGRHPLSAVDKWTYLIQSGPPY